MLSILCLSLWLRGTSRAINDIEECHTEYDEDVWDEGEEEEQIVEESVLKKLAATTNQGKVEINDL